MSTHFPVPQALIALMAVIIPPVAARGATPVGAAALEALVRPNGCVYVMDGDREVAVFRPGFFLKGWDHRGGDGFRPEKGGGKGATLDLGEGRKVALEWSVSSVPEGLSFRYAMTPSADLDIETAYYSASLPAEDWLNAPFTFTRTYAGNANKGVVPEKHAETSLSAGPSTALTLGPSSGRRTLRIKLGSRQQVLLQDSRRWNGGLDIRIEPLGPGTWKAGQRVETSLTVSFGRPVRRTIDGPVTTKAGKEWFPMRGGPDVKAGTALDFSRMGWTRSPAGELGRLRRSPSSPWTLEFADEPGKRVRFAGVNLCFGALFPTHAEADRLAERLMRLGYNTVRIHHYESVSWVDTAGLVDPKAPDSLTFKPEGLDRLDYLYAAFRKRGLYMTTDLYVNRAVKASEVFPGATGDLAYAFKHLVPVSDRAMANMKEFARRLLTHVNPYTGLSYAADPALAWISLINEDNIGNDFGGLGSGPEEKALWEAAFAKWKAETGLKGEWGDDTFRRFAWETQGKAEREIIAFLRAELGVKALITDQNGWTDQFGTQVCRTAFDYVDNHFYWEHPAFENNDWQPPSRAGGKSAIRSAGGFAHLGLTRLLDRPFTISEFNFCTPNPFRAEGGPLYGAFAAIQDWSVLWRFAYSHGDLSGTGGVSYFDLISDPLRQASEYPLLTLFVRGDAAPSRATIAIAGPATEYSAGAHRWLGGDIDRLGWCARIGTLVGPLPSGADTVALGLEEGLARGAAAKVAATLKERGLLPAGNSTDPGKERYESSTGEVVLDAPSGVMTVNTPRTVVLAGPSGTAATLGPVTVRIRDTWACVFLTSLDGVPLAESSHVLVGHLTDMRNTGQTFRDRSMEVLDSFGGAPRLVRAGTAIVRLSGSRRLDAFRLAPDGARSGKVKGKPVKGAVEFTASTATKPDATLFYELVAPAGKPR